MKDTSLQAFTDAENTRRRVSAKRAILAWMQTFSDQSFTVIEIYQANSKHGITYQTALKRLSDLSSEGKIKAVGTDQIGRQHYTLWQFDPSGNASKRVSWKQAYEIEINKCICAINDYKLIANEHQTINAIKALDCTVALMEEIKSRAEQIKNGEI